MVKESRFTPVRKEAAEFTQSSQIEELRAKRATDTVPD
jgi:hypothetical protein